MSVTYNTANDSTWGQNQTTRSCTVNCSGTYRYGLAWAVSDEELPTSVTWGGVAMTLLDSYSNQSGWWFGVYELEDPPTGSQTVLATWPDSQPNIYLTAMAAASTSAAITVLDTDKNTGTTGGGGSTGAATVNSSTTDLTAAACVSYDALGFGEGYYPTWFGGAAKTTAVRSDSNGGGASGAIAGSAGSTTHTFQFDESSGAVVWHIIAVSLTDSGGGGGTDISPNNMGVGVSLTQPTITQAHAIAPNNQAVGVSLTQPTITQAHAIAPNNQAVGISLTEPTIDEALAITVDDQAVGVSLEEPAITQVHAIAPNNQAVSVQMTASTVTAGGDPPAGTVGFGMAVGHDALAFRDITTTDTDFSNGYHLEYAYSVNGGAFSNWTTIDLGSYSGFALEWYFNNWPYQFNDNGTPFTPGDYITVKMRPANNAGGGTETAAKTYRLHESWHRTGVKRHKPSAAVGHVSRLYDVVPTDPIEGQLTTGGQNAAVLAFTSVAYGDEGPTGREALEHTFRYNGVDATKLWSYPSSGDPLGSDHRDENGGCGGTEGFVIVQSDWGGGVGAMTAGFDWDVPQDERALAFAICAVKNVHQSAPVAFHKTKMWSIDYQLTESPHVGVNLASDATYDDVIDGSHCNFHNPDIAASYDELVLSFLECYGTSYAAGTSYPNAHGETTNWTGGGGTSSPDSGENFPMAPSNELTLFAGVGNGQEDACRLALYDDGAIPDTMPLHMQRWHATVINGHGWGGVTGVSVRPTPNMISSPAVPAANTIQINWQCAIECNHGTILIAITAQSDPEPTAAQIQDEIESQGSSDYTGTIVLLDTKELIQTDVSATGGTLSGVSSGIPIGSYRMTQVYQPQQGFKGGTGSISTQQSVLFNVTSIDIDPTDMGVGVSLTAPALTQRHTVTPANMNVAVTETQPTITQVHAISPEALAVGVNLTQPVLTQVHAVSPANLAVTTTLSSPNVSVGAIALPNNMQVAVSLTAPALTQLHEIDPNDLLVGTTLTSPVVSSTGLDTLVPLNKIYLIESDDRYYPITGFD